MISKVRAFLQEQKMDFKENMVFVALSGGADSVCLFLMLLELEKEFGYTLRALHVEHGIRDEDSKKDEAFVRTLCEKHGVACEVCNVNVPQLAKEWGMGIEEAARKARYDFFEEKGKGAFVALAHHREDNAETVLFQMCRGSGVQGMCGMQPIRKEEHVTYLRPLFDCSRKEIEAYLEQCQQGYCVDVTNADTQYTRNAIRTKVLPELENVNDQAVMHLHEGAKRLSVVYDFLRKEAECAYEKVVEERGSGIWLHRGRLQELHPAIMGEVVLMGLANAVGTRKDLGSVQVEQVLDLLTKQSGKQVMLGKGKVARVEYEWICIAGKEEKEQKGSIVLTLEELERGGEISLPGTDGKLSFCVKEYSQKPRDITKKTYTKAFNYDMIKDSLQVRTRVSGDYLVMDAQGHHKKLKSYLVEQKVPVSKRDAVWLIAMQQEVLWVIGGRMNEAYKVAEDTTRILEFTYSGGTDYDGFFDKA